MEKDIIFTITLLLLIVIIGIYKITHNTEYITENEVTHDKRFKNVDQEIVNEIYSLLDIIDKILTKNKIDYWMDGGTYLGAVRHKGLIPWDDDGDIQIWSKDESALLNLKFEFSKHNIILKNTWFGYKLYYDTAKPIKGSPWLYPAIDIFPVSLVNGKIKYTYKKAQYNFSKCQHDYKKLYPLERYDFGPLKLLGSSKQDTKTYFDKCYGKDWDTHAYQTFDHENEKMIKKQKIKLYDHEKLPAIPKI